MPRESAREPPPPRPAAQESAWSPDGRWIAFASDRRGEIGLYKIRPDGSDEMMITPGFCHPTEGGSASADP